LIYVEILYENEYFKMNRHPISNYKTFDAYINQINVNLLQFAEFINNPVLVITL